MSDGIHIFGEGDEEADAAKRAADAAMQAQCLSDPRLAALLEHGNQVFTWETDVLTMMSMIGQVQLALRHPQNAGEAGRLAEVFVRSVQQQIARFDLRLSSLIEDGFNPESDKPWETLEDPAEQMAEGASDADKAAVACLNGALGNLGQAIDPLRAHKDQTLWMRVCELGATLAELLDDLTRNAGKGGRS